jgi:formylglycine-generating enzyme required for sulfatase activity
MAVIPRGQIPYGRHAGNGPKDEQPVYEVHIRKPIVVSRYEITFDQYDDFDNETGRDLPDDEGCWDMRRAREPRLPTGSGNGVTQGLANCIELRHPERQQTDGAGRFL